MKGKGFLFCLFKIISHLVHVDEMKSYLDCFGVLGHIMADCIHFLMREPMLNFFILVQNNDIEFSLKYCPCKFMSSSG